MANSGYNPRSIRPKTGARAHYYEGYMEKKDAKDKNFKKYWTGILGKTLYFYNNYKDVQEIEKLDLENFVSLIDESSSANQTEHRLLLKLKGMEVKLKVENLELRELWKGFILTVIQLRIPANLILLPGHLCMLREALDKEEQRLNELMNSQYNRVNGDDKPSCFYRVSRMEAQALLESNPECGNLLVRPGTDETNFSISICYKYCGQPTTKHYKVKMTGKEYVLQVEPPRNFSSLTEIVDYFVTNTQNKLTPFEWDINYEERIILPQVDDESGESTLIFPSPPPVLPKKPNERVLPAIPTDPLPSDQDTYDLVDEDANEYMIPELSHRMSPLPEIPSRIPVKPKTPTNANVKPKTPTNVTVKPRTPTNMTVKPVPIGNITQELSEKLRIQRMKLEEQ
ncbi:signal-transducing adaptor protein 2 isoform X2 [Microcaecilia unicolor]|uniref:Signal-transducing adaptor protein 2 isoform X2 n=1 Tax=Microcaecilia unicolor TaxID=1415580 RepID=A0A6P7Z1F2_9AMPH|nr:signal-transducing adaptor protein 2 isoform X2 [Microcaecilia unicolor]